MSLVHLSEFLFEVLRQSLSVAKKSCFILVHFDISGQKVVNLKEYSGYRLKEPYSGNGSIYLY